MSLHFKGQKCIADEISGTRFNADSDGEETRPTGQEMGFNIPVSWSKEQQLNVSWVCWF